MNELSAKTHFQKTHTPEQLTNLADFFNGPICRSAFVATTASMSEQRFTQEQMIGAIAFRDRLLNIAEVNEVPKPLPVKNLQEVPTVLRQP